MNKKKISNNVKTNNNNKKSAGNSMAKQKREIRRRVRQYEEAYRANFGHLNIQGDLETACRSRKDVQEVVLITYAMAKISMMTQQKSTKFEDDDNDMRTSVAQRFGPLLWEPRVGPDADETPLVWALEVAAKDVVRFILAWYIVDKLSMTMTTATDSDAIAATTKHSLMEWLTLVGDANLFQGHCRKTLSAMLENYTSFHKRKVTLERMVSCLIAPAVAPYPFLKKYVDQVSVMAVSSQVMQVMPEPQETAGQPNQRALPPQVQENTKPQPEAKPKQPEQELPKPETEQQKDKVVVPVLSTISEILDGGGEDDDEFSFCLDDSSCLDESSDDADLFSLVTDDGDENTAEGDFDGSGEALDSWDGSGEALDSWELLVLEV